MQEFKVKLSKLDIAPRKVRAVIRTIAGRSAGDAEAELIFRKERAARPILKLLRSAIANAKQKGAAVDKLYIKTILANEGPVLKRWLPRARGMATPLHKKLSHVTMILAENPSKKSRFKLSEPSSLKKSTKKASKRDDSHRSHSHEKSAPEKKEAKPEKKVVKENKEIKSEKTGASKADNSIKRMFRRKSV
jgi:large subunit ribosomal protein L22